MAVRQQARSSERLVGFWISLVRLASPTKQGRRITGNTALVTLEPLHDWPAGALLGEIRIHDNVSLPACEVTTFDAEQTAADATRVDECGGNTGVGTCS